MSEVNPYESPESIDLGVTLNHLASVRRTYWWVYAIGTTVGALYVVAAGIVAFIWLAGRRPTADDIGIAFQFGIPMTIHFLFMNYCRLVGMRLESEPTKYRGRARLTGLVMSILYFPVFTGPGLYCVWKIHKHFEA